MKNQQIPNNSATADAREKISSCLESYDFWSLLMYVPLDLRVINIYLLELATEI